MPYNQKTTIIRHYNVVSPYYRSLWGAHLHHGFWQDGNETPVEAQTALTEELIRRANLAQGVRILDVGCGMGGSSIHLAKKLKALVTGITISPVQLDMAREAAEREDVRVNFELMDADNMVFPDTEMFDCIWSIEAISHFSDKEKFFREATKLLVPGGTIAMIDWFRKPGVTDDRDLECLREIEQGMFVELETLPAYLNHIRKAGNTVTHTDNLSDSVARTWDICSDIIGDKALWSVAEGYGDDFVDFLKSFAAMQNGYASRVFEYHLIIARKN